MAERHSFIVAELLTCFGMTIIRDESRTAQRGGRGTNHAGAGGTSRLFLRIDYAAFHFEAGGGYRVRGGAVFESLIKSL